MSGSGSLTAVNRQSTPTRRGGLLHHRDFRLLWIGESTSSIGTAITVVALPLVAVTTLRASTFTVSLLYATAWVPWLVLGLPAGAWVDRLPRRRVMLTCDAVSVVSLLSVPIASWLGLLTLGQLLVVASVAGTAAVFFSTAYTAFLPSLVPRHDLVEGNTKLQGSRAAAQIAGPGAAGLLAQLFGAVFGLLADAFTFVASALCLFAIDVSEPAVATRRRERHTRLATDIREGLSFAVHDPYLRVLTIYGALGNLALTGWQTLEVVFLIRVVGVSSATVGILLATIGIGGVIGAFSAGVIAKRCGTGPGMLICALGTTPFSLLIPLTGPGPRVALFAVGGLVVSAGLAASNVIGRSFRQAHCPPELLGRITASTRTLGYGAIPVGALVAGELATLLGTRDALWIVTSLLIASSTTLLSRAIREQPRDAVGGE